MVAAGHVLDLGTLTIPSVPVDRTTLVPGGDLAVHPRELLYAMGFCWNTLYLREAIGDVRFDPAHPLFEDTVFNLDLMARVDRAAFIPSAQYHYVQHGAARLTNRPQTPDLRFRAELTRRYEEQCEAWGLTEQVRETMTALAGWGVGVEAARTTPPGVDAVAVLRESLDDEEVQWLLQRADGPGLRRVDRPVVEALRAGKVRRARALARGITRLATAAGPAVGARRAGRAPEVSTSSTPARLTERRRDHQEVSTSSTTETRARPPKPVDHRSPRAGPADDIHGPHERRRDPGRWCRAAHGPRGAQAAAQGRRAHHPGAHDRGLRVAPRGRRDRARDGRGPPRHRPRDRPRRRLRQGRRHHRGRRHPHRDHVAGAGRDPPRRRQRPLPRRRTPAGDAPHHHRLLRGPRHPRGRRRRDPLGRHDHRGRRGPDDPRHPAAGARCGAGRRRRASASPPSGPRTTWRCATPTCRRPTTARS